MSLDEAFPDVRAGIVDALCLFGGGPPLTDDEQVVQTVMPQVPSSAQHCGTIARTPSVEPELVHERACRALETTPQMNIWVSTVTENRTAGYLWRRGCPLGWRVLGMVADRDSWRPPKRREAVGAELRAVNSPEAADMFRHLRRGLGECDAAIDFFARDAVLLDDHCDAVVAVDSAHRPCAGGMAVYSPGFQRAGLYWVATAASHRRRGIGTVVTAALTEHALVDGRCRSVSLQATPAGAGVYEALGFVGVEPYDRFIVSGRSRRP